MSAAELRENAHEGEGAMSGELPQDILFTVVREITTERLNSYGPGVASAPQEVAEEDMSYDHWIGEITLCFPSIEIAFRSHFSSKVARVFAVAMLGDEEPVAPLVCHSFMTELCNLTAGALKNVICDVITEAEDDGDLGLPERKPSFDLASLNVEPGTSSSSWKYEVDGMPLVCRVTLKIDAVKLQRRHGLSPGEFATRVRELHENPPALDDFDDFLLE